MGGGRSREDLERMGQAVHAAIHQALGGLGVAGEDIVLGYVENGPEGWTFGFGRARYLTGELEVPSASEVPALNVQTNL